MEDKLDETSIGRKCIPKIYNSVEIKMAYSVGSTIVVF